MKKLAAFFVLMLASAIFAQPQWEACNQANPITGNVCRAMTQLCTGIQTLIPVASMLMLVIAAVIYAAGQMMGAETRARANVWATAALTGALIGILIVAIAPTVLRTIYADSVNGTVCPAT